MRYVDKTWTISIILWIKCEIIKCQFMRNKDWNFLFCQEIGILIGRNVKVNLKIEKLTVQISYLISLGHIWKSLKALN